VTGALNSILVYVLAYNVQLATTTVIRWRRCSHVPDIEAARAQTTGASYDPPERVSQTRPLGRGIECADWQLGQGTEQYTRRQHFQKHISDTSTLCTISGDMNEADGSESTYRRHAGGVNENQNAQSASGAGEIFVRDRQGKSSTRVQTNAHASRSSRVWGVVFTWLSHNLVLTLSFLILLFVGLPVSFLQHNDIYTDVAFLLTIWLTISSAQLRTKQHTIQGHHHIRALTAAVTLLNPVLWTSLLLVCYGLAKSSIRNQSSAAVIAGFSTKNTVSDLIGSHIHSRPPAFSSSSLPGHIPIGAGDVATSILNAGIVSWGLKLFEYRHQIFSSGGFTVVAISLLTSLFNVVVWPLLAHSLGVRPASWDLSFAARSVTIALGGPAMKSLGGDAGINAVGVVINGICFQLAAGFLSDGNRFTAAAGRCKHALMYPGWAGLVWNGRVDEQHELDSLTPTSARRNASHGLHTEEEPHPDRDQQMKYSSDATNIGEQRPEDQSEAADWGTTGAAAKDNDGNTFNAPRNNHGHAARALEEKITYDPLTAVQTVAAGVTIGVNAAAMGTAHLYEQESGAAPFSALSMTMFGVFTVFFTLRSPMTEWLSRRVGGGGTEAAMMML
jgi:putative effector of murein hydrolase